MGVVFDGALRMATAARVIYTEAGWRIQTLFKVMNELHAIEVYRLALFFVFLRTPKHRAGHLDEYIQVEKDEIIITLVLAKYEQPFEARRGP